jgi:hypothetical protein
VFNVVIEKELDINNDPLIIKEDINDIVQSIEEQLYNINVSYRNHVRKIKNNIKSLEGVSESTFVILEDDNVNDDNLIYYLTNVLEISLDCVVATLCESREFKPQLSTVNSLTDLLQIDHPNIKVCNQIIENCKELFSVYSEVNEKKLSSTAFYEILDESITRSVKRNVSETVTVEDFQENKIYNLVIENLDTLIGPDLVSTYDNIKLFAANQVSVQENFLTSLIGWLGNTARPLWIKATGVTIGAFAVVGSFTAMTWLANYALNLILPGRNVSLDSDLSKFRFFSNGSNNELKLIIYKVLNNDKLKTEEIDKLFNTYKELENNTDGLTNPKLEIHAFLRVLINDKGLLQQYNEEIKTQLRIAQDQIQTNTSATTELTKTLETAKENLATVQQKLAVAEEQVKTSSGQGLETLRAEIKKLETERFDIDRSLSKLQNDILTNKDNLAGIEKSITDKKEDLSEVTKLLARSKENFKGFAQEIEDLLGNTGFTIAAITVGIVGLGIVTYLLGILFIRGKIFLTKDSADTIKAILKLRKKIDALRKSVVVTFPELVVQFNFIDSEVKKCEQESTRKNDVLMAYQCSMKYFMGSYALIMYSTLVQFVKDGGSLNSFNKLSDVHSYKGFATMTTRQLINELNSFYSLMIEYDATMSDAFESIFYLMKKQILENKGSDNIIKQLPNNLALGRV